MKYGIWHVRDIFLGEVAFGWGRLGMFPDEFAEVAQLEADSLNAAFAASQNLEDSWLKNPTVVSNREGCRSTSVGDVIVEDGIAYLVERVGFRKLW